MRERRSTGATARGHFREPQNSEVSLCQSSVGRSRGVKSRRLAVPGIDPELQAVVTAVAHPVRRFLIELMEVDDATASDLAASASDAWGISIPRASQHLQVLARADLVTVIPHGSYRFYRRNVGAAASLSHWLRAVELEC